MSKPKPIPSAIHLMYGAPSPFVQGVNPADLERFPGGVNADVNLTHPCLETPK